ERLSGARRGRAQHELGLDVGAAHVLRDALGAASAPRRERPLVVGERGVVPARLGVAEDEERAGHTQSVLRRSVAAPSTSARTMQEQTTTTSSAKRASRLSAAVRASASYAYVNGRKTETA